LYSCLGGYPASCQAGIGLQAPVEGAYPVDKAVRVAGSLRIDLVVAVVLAAAEAAVEQALHTSVAAGPASFAAAVEVASAESAFAEGQDPVGVLQDHLVVQVPLMTSPLVGHLVGVQHHLAVVAVGFAVSKRLPSSWGWLSKYS